MEIIEKQLKELSENLKRARKSNGLSQMKLAELADISQSYLANVETGKYNPSIETILKLCNALEINAGELFPVSFQVDDKEAMKNQIFKLIEKL